MTENKRQIRIALPSKGLLEEGSKKLLADVGLGVHKPNPRQYIAWIPHLPGVEVIFQRPGDIVISVRDGSVDFGITGRDIYLEKKDADGKIIELHSNLGFGKCTLNVIVPDQWTEMNTWAEIHQFQSQLGRPLKVATKFPNLTESFFAAKSNFPIEVIQAEGALEIAPTVGYADIIVDLVSTGTTLRDNRLKKISEGKLLDSEACLIANKECLKSNSKTLAIATQLLELVCAHLRARENLAIFANVRGNSEEEIAEKVFKQNVIYGLQGPTISPIITREVSNYFALHIVVKKGELHNAIQEIREIGGSGVVVTPVDYIFEEEPQELSSMISALEDCDD
jgi:ATP phosphoribosyltransferase